MKSYCKTFVQTCWELKENFSLRTFSGTLGHNVQAMLSLNILRRLLQNIFRMFLENVILEHSGNLERDIWGGCSSVGRAGCLVIRRSLVQIPAPRAELSCMLKWSWGKYWIPNCCWRAVGTWHLETIRHMRVMGNTFRNQGRWLDRWLDTWGRASDLKGELLFKIKQEDNPELDNPHHGVTG